MVLSRSLGTTRCDPQEKSPHKEYNKPFIGQACSVPLQHGFLRVYGLRLSFYEHTRKKLTIIQPS